ncbi:MAG: hypothetical protein ACE5GT_01770 [Rhodospirillales bacterium]
MHFSFVFFFLSGFAALLYQLVWQRALFTIFGTNIESITVVVAAFMLGLGIGSVAGGRLSRVPGIRLLVAFAAVELATGAFGLGSLALFDQVARLTLDASGVATFLAAFALVVVPTVLMGSTLPLLVAFLVRRQGNVGRSVGILYCVNTLGSAAACLAVSLWLFKTLDMSDTVRLAAALNVVIGAGALMLARRLGPAPPMPPTPAQASAGPRRRLWAAMGLLALTGFVSLSYEIVWARIYAIGASALAVGFTLMLGFFLAGIALGSLAARVACRESAGAKAPWNPAAVPLFVLAANLIGFLVVPAVAAAVGLGASWPATLPLVALGATLLGAVLPLVSHQALAADERVGSGLGRLYMANILGGVGGSLVTGFVLMDVWGTQGISVFLLVLGLAVSAGLGMQGGRRARRRLATAIVPVLVLGVGLSGVLFDRLYERLNPAMGKAAGGRFAEVIENKSGVITVTPAGVVFGNGLYDGAFNTDPLADTNGIIRPYLMSAFHPAPGEVLMIGLGSGSWARVVAANPDVRRLTIIEINPGYVELVRRHREVAPLLDDPKVTIVIDDGRRWLARHPDRRFDFIIANTTWNWRAYATNLLSVEFLGLIRAHLGEGGVYFFNATGSERVHGTAATAFPHAYRVSTMMAVSDRPMEIDAGRWRTILARTAIDGRLVDGANRVTRAAFEPIFTFFDRRVAWTPGSALRYGYETRADVLARTRGMAPITDDNMGTEWGRPARSGR